MIHPADITDDTWDITARWQRLTGLRVKAATAHLRGGMIVTVTIRDVGRLVMCRAGACALITANAVAAIETEARKRRHCPHPRPAAPGTQQQDIIRMFGKLFGKKAEAAVQKFSGRTDFLEGCAAVSALVAGADGDISDSEVSATLKAIKANKALEGFDARTVEQTAEKMLKRVMDGRIGKMEVRREVMEVSKDMEFAEAMILTALDVAEADGSIGDAEMRVLEGLAKDLGVNLQNLLAA